MTPAEGLVPGIVGALAGGVVFGMLMEVMGMMPAPHEVGGVIHSAAVFVTVTATAPEDAVNAVDVGNNT